MKTWIVCIVRDADAQAWEALGWTCTDCLVGTRLTLIEWRREDEPVLP